jgi:hypothetical protein
MREKTISAATAWRATTYQNWTVQLADWTMKPEKVPLASVPNRMLDE